MSRIFKLLFAADLHIDSKYPNSAINQVTGLDIRLEDLSKKLFKMIEICKGRGAEAIVVAGDIFNDPNPDPIAQGVFIDFLIKCYNEKVHVFVIPGQHDIRGDYISFSALCKLTFWKEYIHLYLKPIVAKMGDCRIKFIPFGMFDDVKENDNTSDIIVMHGIPSGVSVNGILMTGDTRINEFADKSKVAIIGDIHLSVGNEDSHYLIPGSIMRLNFGEANDAKGICLLTMEDGNPSENEFIDMEDRNYITLTITKDSDIEKLLNDINEGDILRIFVGRKVNVTMLKEKIEEKKPLSYKILHSEELLNEECGVKVEEIDVLSKQKLRKVLMKFIKNKDLGQEVLSICEKELGL